MTFSRETTVWCDSCGTWEQEADSSVRRVRRSLRKRGWRHTRTEDFCPSCVKKLTPASPAPEPPFAPPGS